MIISQFLKRKKFQHYVAMPVLVLSLISLSCKETKTEYSRVLHERAIVSDVVYTPSTHGSGSGIGPTIDMDGNIGMAFTSTSINIPEKYAVVFKCQHGKFISEGTDERHKSLWEKLEEDMEVNVSYREIFKSVYENDKDKDGKKDLISRELIGYDFLDAQPQKK